MTAAAVIKDRFGRMVKRYSVTRARVGDFFSNAGRYHELEFDQEHGIVGMSAKVELIESVAPQVAGQGNCVGLWHIRINKETDTLGPDVPNHTVVFMPIITTYKYATDFTKAEIFTRGYHQRFRYPVIFRRDNIQYTGGGDIGQIVKPRFRVHIDFFTYTGGLEDDGQGVNVVVDWRATWWVDIASGPGWNRNGELAGVNGAIIGGTSSTTGT